MKDLKLWQKQYLSTLLLFYRPVYPLKRDIEKNRQRQSEYRSRAE